MAKPRSRDSGRFRIYVSDRSGFEYGFKPITSKPNAYTRESGKPVQDLGLRVSPTEFDTPPPSKLPLGGVGDINNTNVRPNSDFTDTNAFIVPPESVKTINYISAGISIPWNQDPTIYITGSNSSITMSSNPQIVRGQQGQQLAFECIGSGITLNSSNGLTFDFIQPFITMQSGSIITAIYNSTDSTWHITSFNLNGGL